MLKTRCRKIGTPRRCSPANRSRRRLYGAGLLLLPLAAAALQLAEHQVKAAFLQNFSLFFYWPKENDSTPRRICILGENPFENALETVIAEYNKSASLPRALSYINSPAQLDGCHILYITDDSVRHQKAIIEYTQAHALLTVSSIEGFARHGGMIEFYLNQDKMRFYINQDAVLQSGLKADANLLRVGTLVKSE